MDFIRWLLCNLGFKFVFPNFCKKKLSTAELVANTHQVFHEALDFREGGGKSRRKTQRRKKQKKSKTRRQ